MDNTRNWWTHWVDWGSFRYKLLERQGKCYAALAQGNTSQNWSSKVTKKNYVFPLQKHIFSCRNVFVQTEAGQNLCTLFNAVNTFPLLDANIVPLQGLNIFVPWSNISKIYPLGYRRNTIENIWKKVFRHAVPLAKAGVAVARWNIFHISGPPLNFWPGN
jgi:hypothetical protein